VSSLLAITPSPAAAVSQRGAPACSVDQLSHTTGDHALEVDIDADGDHIVVTSLKGLDGSNPGSNVEVWVWSPDHVSDTNHDGFLQVTESQTGTATSASISDDGDVVAFSTGANISNNQNADGNQEVFSFDLGQGVLEQQSFSAGGAGNQGATLSGDGGTLAWHSDRNLIGQNPNLRPQVYRLDLVTPGAVEQQITAVPAGRTAVDPSLSVDGNVVAFTSDMTVTGGNADGGVEQWRTGPIGGFELLTTSPATGGFQHPTSMSADGAVVAFSDNRTFGGRNLDLSREVWIETAGEGLRPVTDIDPAVNTGSSTQPTIDAAGGRVAFTSTARVSFEEPGNETTPDIFVQDLATTRTSQVTPPGLQTSYAGDVAISADGTRIAFVSDMRSQQNQDGNRELFLATCGSPRRVFTDVPTGHVFFGEIGWMAETGISTGYQPGPTYRPAAVVTRGAMAAFLFRLAGQDLDDVEPPATPTFRDVGQDHPFFLEIEWMADAGVTTGHPDGTYRFAEPVSRGAMSAFLYRLAGEPAVTLPPSPSFLDVGAGHPFVRPIQWMYEEGISSGYGTVQGYEYRPAEPVTRQAMSAFLQRTKLAYPGIGES
jgi:Tol biopolymer transport system component